MHRDIPREACTDDSMRLPGAAVNFLSTVWIYAATFLEEADLFFDLGDAYRDYQRKVPRLLPWRRH